MGGKKQPKPPSPPPTVTATDVSVTDAANREKQRILAKRGRGSTVLTGRDVWGSGVSGMKSATGA